MKKAKSFRNSTLLMLVMMLMSICTISYGQHHHAPVTQATEGKDDAFKAGGIKTQALTDPELKKYSYTAAILELAPGFLDTIAHRHDAELFVFVLEGTVEIQLENNAPATYTKGQMFYEYPNVLHTRLRNLSSSKPAKLMLNFIIKEGRQAYRVEYPSSDIK